MRNPENPQDSAFLGLGILIPWMFAKYPGIMWNPRDSVSYIILNQDLVDRGIENPDKKPPLINLKKKLAKILLRPIIFLIESLDSRGLYQIY